MPTLTLTPETHTYQLDGLEVLGVSKIIALAGLSDMTWCSEEALKRGSFVHTALEYEDQGQLDEADLDPKLLGYVNAWRKFKTEAKATVHAIESRVFHPLYKYAGTLDRLIEIDGKTYLVDIKSGSPDSWHPIQTALYAMTFDLPAGNVRPLRAAVYVSSEGKYSFIIHAEREDFNVAKAAITIAGFKGRTS